MDVVADDAVLRETLVEHLHDVAVHGAATDFESADDLNVVVVAAVA